MKRSLLIFSLAANLALLAFLFFPLSKGEKTAPPPNTPRTQVLTRTIVQEVTAPVETNVIPGQAAERFHWSALQTTNFPEYAAKLRAIGCPPQTVRDIITGEINDWMLPQRRMIIAPYAPRFWEYVAKGEMDIPSEIKEPLKELKKARQELLNAALKDLPASESTPNRPSKKDHGIAMLSEETQGKIRDLEKKYGELQAEVTKKHGKDRNERNKQLNELAVKKEAEKRSLMSPEELAEYKVILESSRMRGLYGFETTPEEMRTIASVYANHSKLSDVGIPPTEEAVREQSARRDAELKAMLGEKRFAEYQMSSKDSFKEVYQLTEAYKLPKETAIKVYELQETFQQEALAIQKNTTLSKEERTAAVAELRDNYDDATALTLGEKAAASYRKMRRSRSR